MENFCLTISTCVTYILPGLIASLCLLAYLVVIITIIRNWSIFNHPFYKLALSLAVADCADLIRSICYPFCEGIIQKNGIFTKIYGFFSYWCWYAEVFTLLAIAVNRFVFITCPLVADKKWSPKVTISAILLPWILSLPYGVFPTLDDHYIYHVNRSYPFFDTNKSITNHFVSFALSTDAICASIIAVTYLCCFQTLWKWKKLQLVRRNSKLRIKRRSERNLLTQAILIWGLMIGVDVVGVVLLYAGLTEKQWDILATLYLLLTKMFNGVNPFIYLIMNTTLRKCIKHDFFK